MASRRVNLLVRTGILVGLSMVLVFGFWEHRNFYQFGLPALLVGGGLVTFLVILGFRMALSGQLPHGRLTGEVVLSEAQGDGILRGTVQLLICSADDPRLPSVGRIVHGRYESGRVIGRLKVVDGVRKRLADVTEEEAHRAGYRSTADLRTARGKARSEGLVAVLRVEAVEGGA